MIELSGESMGSIWRVKIAEALTRSDVCQIQAKIEYILRDVNQCMSPYIDSSEIQLFNRYQGKESFPISAELRQVVSAALDICDKTHGRYDITVAPLVNAWGFGAKEVEDYPDAEQIQEMLLDVDYRKLVLNHAGLQKENPKISIDLCSIAKGYGVDQVAVFLESIGIHHYLVDIGGESRIAGSKYNHPWILGLERPQWGGGHYEYTLTFKDTRIGVATSGNYKNYRSHSGQVAAHEINTKTGCVQVSSILSVTVLADNCMLADGYATALFLLGDDAIAFANQNDIPALFMLQKGTTGSAQSYQVECSELFQRIIGKI